FYRVEAFDASVPPIPSQISADISATPFAPPGPPTGLTLHPASGKIVVNWLPGTPGTFAAQDFHIFRRTGPGTDFELAAPGPSATYYSDNALVNGTTYTYY